MNVSSAGHGATMQTLAGKGSLSASMMKKTAEAEASVAIMATSTANQNATNNLQSTQEVKQVSAPKSGAKGQVVDIEV
jgi:hypothetical protein